MTKRLMTPSKLTTHEKYVAQVHAEGRTATPFRIGLAVGAAGDTLSSPYPPGTRGDHSYLDGVEYGRTERRVNAKACELYHASSANDPTPAWWELNGMQKWPWREKAIEALAAGVDSVQAPSCDWREEDPFGAMPGTYASACGELWSFTDGGPKENSVRFCHGCGKPVNVIQFPEPADDDAAGVGIPVVAWHQRYCEVTRGECMQGCAAGPCKQEAKQG